MFPHLLIQPLKLAIVGVGGYVLYKIGKNAGKKEAAPSTASNDNKK